MEHTKELVSVTQPAKGSASIVDGKVVFTPGAAFDYLAAGETAIMGTALLFIGRYIIN